MKSVCFYFQVHQPYRVKRYRVFDIGSDPEYFNDRSETDLNNRRIVEKVARKSYIPATRLLLSLLQRHPEFKVSFSFSGIALEQLARYAPEALDLFKQDDKTRHTEKHDKTNNHTHTKNKTPTEFERQVAKHRDLIR